MGLKSLLTTSLQVKSLSENNKLKAYFDSKLIKRRNQEKYWITKTIK